MKKINSETFLEYKFLSEPRVSPNGKTVLFVVNLPDVEDNNYKNNLYIYNTDDSGVKKLTERGNVRNPQWIDDTTIMFSSSRCPKIKEKLQQGEEITEYYTISILGGEAQKLFDIDLLVNNIKPLNNDCYLITAKFDNNRPSLEGLSKADRKEVLKDYKEKGYTVFEEAPFWFNGAGVTNRKRNRLYIYDNKTKELKVITEPLFNVTNSKTNGKYVLYQGGSFDTFIPMKNGLYLYNLETNENITLIEPNEIRTKFMEIYGDNKIVLSCEADEKYGFYQNGDVYIMDIKTGSKTLLVKHEHQSIGHSTTGTDARFGGGNQAKLLGDLLYYTTTRVNHGHINTLNLKTGEILEITEAGSADCFDMVDNIIYMVAMRNDNLGELYSLENGIEKKLTSFNDFINEEYSVSTPEEVICKNRAGIDVHGYAMKPVGYIEGNSYPAILHIHGGPRTAFSSIFHNEMQLWANNGYFVFYCNPRGSDGKGNDFANIIGKYGKDDFEDIMDFTDKVLELYEDIDENRVGVTGGSYGGFMTNWIIGNTDRYRCACSQRSISNWTTFEGTTDIGYFFSKDQTGASHMEDQSIQWEQSPLKYANQVKTPTLFIHSEEDYRCWLVEPLQMFSALKMHNVPTKICLFKGENHELSRSGRPRNRIKRMDEILEWMNEYLK